METSTLVSCITLLTSRHGFVTGRQQTPDVACDKRDGRAMYGTRQKKCVHKVSNGREITFEVLRGAREM